MTKQPSSSNYPARLHFTALPGKAISTYSFLPPYLTFCDQLLILRVSIPGFRLICVSEVSSRSDFPRVWLIWTSFLLYTVRRYLSLTFLPSLAQPPSECVHDAASVSANKSLMKDSRGFIRRLSNSSIALRVLYTNHASSKTFFKDLLQAIATRPSWLQPAIHATNDKRLLPLPFVNFEHY